MTDPQPYLSKNSRRPAPGQGMNLGRLWRLTRKELRETLRDRRTIVTLLLMPLLVYPLLSLAFRQFLFSSYSTATSSPTSGWTVGVAGDDEFRVIGPLLRAGDEMIRRKERGPMKAKSGAFANLPPEIALDRVDWRIPVDVETALNDGDIDVGIRLMKVQRTDKRELGEPYAVCELLYRSQSAASINAAHYLEARLEALNEAEYQRRLKSTGENFAPVVEFKRSEVGSQTQYSFSLSTLVPLILILMTITGAVYPAIDLTAGERERGTLESLIASPVPRFAVLLAKYFAVVTVAVLTALMNITAMTITVQSTGLAPLMFGAHGLTPASVVAVLGLMVLFAAFFSAVLLTLTSFARSFKEAQAYLVPLMLVAMTPGFLSLVPNVQLQRWWSVMPLANIVLLARDVLEKGPDPTWAIVALASTLVYGLSALVLAAHIFGNDAILYGSEDSWGDWLRSPRRWSLAPTLPMASLTLAVTFPFQVWLAGTVWQRKDITIPGKFLLTGCCTVLLYFVLPSLVARWRKVSFISGFQLRGFSPLTLIGAAILGFSLWPLAYELVVFTQTIGLVSLEEKRQQAQQQAEAIKSISMGAAFFTIAVAPAFCEEWFFRGFLLTALFQNYRRWTAIVLCGMLFGLFHIFSASGLTIERLFSTGLIGCFAAWVAFRSRSVFPGMILHFINNSLFVLLAFYADYLERFGASADPSFHLPQTWQAAGFVGVAIGSTFVWLGTKDQQDVLTATLVPPTPMPSQSTVT